MTKTETKCRASHKLKCAGLNKNRVYRNFDTPCFINVKLQLHISRMLIELFRGGKHHRINYVDHAISGFQVGSGNNRFAAIAIR